ncbi:MAG: hypothetical protein ISS74_06105 [Planctomycetes bacterium]|nr:hypothetical protein [Planctomycetota bacterium]
MRHFGKTFILGVIAAMVITGLAAVTYAATGTGVAWTKYMVRSPGTGKIERFWVGVPAGLDRDGQYPAVYFLPGLLDGDDTWKGALDPHLARHKVVAVCPAVGGATWFMDSPRQPWMKWGEYLRQELRAFVEARYPVSRRKGQRGIAGISAGGHAAFYQAIKHPDLYGSVTVLSGSMDLRGYAGAVGLDYWIGPRSPATLSLYADRSCLVLAARHEGPLPFALALEAGSDDGALAQMQAFRRVLDTKGLAYRWKVSTGGHDWTFWKSRAAEVLAWHAEQFDHNRREGLYTAEAEALPVALEVIEKPPEIGLSAEGLRRLRAPWTETAGPMKPVKTGGLPANGAPLSKTDKQYAEAKFGADLSAAGHEAALFVYRLTVTAASPLPKAGTVALSGEVRNGRQWGLLTVPAAHLPVPAGEPQRQVDLRARIVVELKEPDPIRGGIVVAIQPMDAAGQPAGEPSVGTVQPGTAKLELWPLAPQARSLWRLTLDGPNALPLAAVHEVRMEEE